MHGVTMKLCSSWYQTYIGTLLNSYLVSPAKNGRAPLARPVGWTS